MGAWGAAGLLAVWLASATADGARSAARSENGPGRRHGIARPGVRKAERRRPPTTSRRRTHKSALAAAPEAEGARRAVRRLESPLGASDPRTPPMRSDRAATNAPLSDTRPAPSPPGTRLPPGAVPAG